MDMPDGFIPLPPRVEPQAAFRPLLDDLRRTLARPPFERAVHSIYLYGSVARGEAITGRSDLDLTLVLRDPPSPELAAQLETARLALQARHPEVSKIDFDIGHLDQARDPANRDSWAIGSSTAAAACGAKTWPAPCRPCVRRKPSPWPSTATMRRCWKTMRDAWKARPRRRSAAACNGKRRRS